MKIEKKDRNGASSNRKILFIEPNSIFDKNIIYAIEMGFSPILFTRLKKHNPKLYKKIDVSNFEVVYHIDTLNFEAMNSFVKRLNINVGAVVTCYDDTVLPAARLAKELGLPHVNIQGLENAYRKDKVRDILEKNYIKQPKYEVIDILSSGNPTKVKYPLVMKPVHDSGSEGAYLCRDELEYQSSIKKIQSKQFTWLGAKKSDLLLEEFIEGTLYSADLLWNNGKWNILGFSKVFIDPYKNLCMSGMSFPSDLPSNLLPDIEKQVVKWVNLVGLKGGALCVEFKFYKNEAFLIEINPRLAATIMKINLVLGISPVEYIIKEACGEEKNLVLSNLKKKLFIAYAYIFPKKSGILYEINEPKFLPKNCIEINYSVSKLPIKIKIDDRHHLGNIIGHVIASGKSADDAMHQASKIINEIELKIKY